MESDYLISHFKKWLFEILSQNITLGFIYLFSQKKNFEMDKGRDKFNMREK